MNFPCWPEGPPCKIKQCPSGMKQDKKPVEEIIENHTLFFSRTSASAESSFLFTSLRTGKRGEGLLLSDLKRKARPVITAAILNAIKARVFTPLFTGCMHNISPGAGQKNKEWYNKYYFFKHQAFNAITASLSSSYILMRVSASRMFITFLKV